MGVDAKGRNFSAPRLTPGRRHELMTYGSPAMIKDQDRQIAIMEDRARRYGYMSTAQAAKLGGVTARALGTNEGYRPPVSTSSSYARSMTSAAVSRPMSVSQQQDAKKIVKVIIIIIILFNFAPVVLGMIGMLLQAIFGNL